MSNVIYRDKAFFLAASARRKAKQAHVPPPVTKSLPKDAFGKDNKYMTFMFNVPTPVAYIESQLGEVVGRVLRCLPNTPMNKTKALREELVEYFKIVALERLDKEIAIVYKAAKDGVYVGYTTLKTGTDCDKFLPTATEDDLEQIFFIGS